MYLVPPEKGSIKRAADNFENCGDIEGMRVQAKLPDAASFCKWGDENLNSPFADVLGGSLHACCTK
eukprot:5902185-Prymnesium_polylepis.1